MAGLLVGFVVGAFINVPVRKFVSGAGWILSSSFLIPPRHLLILENIHCTIQPQFTRYSNGSTFHI